MSDMLKTQNLSCISSDVDKLSVNSTCYNDFFLLRTPITINGRPAVIKEVNGEPVVRVNGISVKLSTISQQAVAPVASKHGVYQVDNFYYEQVPLFSVKFHSKSSLKQFLMEKDAVQKEMTSAINNLLKSESEVTQHVDVEVKLYLVTPILGRPTPEVHQVNLVNHCLMMEIWKRSKLFDFTSTMFTKPPPSQHNIVALMASVESSLKATAYTAGEMTKQSESDSSNEYSGSDENAKLADLQVELRKVTEWFSLGVQLSIPTDELMAIRKDHRYTFDCRLEMLIRWEQLEKPTWTKLATALVNIGRRDIAERIARKYGVPLNSLPDSPHAREKETGRSLELASGFGDQPYVVTISQVDRLLLMEDEVERAVQSRDKVRQTLETDIDTTLPELQMKVSSLSQDVKLLKTKLKNKEEENEMLDEANQNLKKWNDAIQRTRRENVEAIKLLKEEIRKREDELALTRGKLEEKKKELSLKMEELDMKSARVCELQNEIEEMRRKFNDQQEEMDQKLIESKALAQSREKYLEEIEIQRDIVTREASITKEKVQSYTLELKHKEEQISELLDKISEHKKEMATLREELDSYHRTSTSQQLSNEQMLKTEEKEDQLLALLLRTMGNKLELKKTEEKFNSDKMILDGAQKIVQKYERMLSEHSTNQSETENAAVSESVVSKVHEPQPILSADIQSQRKAHEWVQFDNDNLDLNLFPETTAHDSVTLEANNDPFATMDGGRFTSKPQIRIPEIQVFCTEC